MTSSSVIHLETELLESMITRGWHYLFRFQAVYAEEKQELDSFLDRYYAQIRGWLQQAAEAAGTGEGGETTSKSVNHLHAHHKSLYREAMKLCHPDICPHPQAAHWLREAVAAYAAGDGYRLVRLKLEILSHTQAQQSHYAALHHEYCWLKSQVSQTRASLHQLRQTPAYRLQQRVAHTKRQEVDLLAQISGQWRPSFA